MDKLRRLRLYYDAYRELTDQLAGPRFARAWMEAGVPAEQAAAWARIGCLPEEAMPLIASGMTPEMVVAADPTTEAERMQYLADRIGLLAADDAHPNA